MGEVRRLPGASPHLFLPPQPVTPSGFADHMVTLASKVAEAKDAPLLPRVADAMHHLAYTSAGMTLSNPYAPPRDLYPEVWDAADRRQLGVLGGSAGAGRLLFGYVWAAHKTELFPEGSLIIGDDPKGCA